MIQPSDISGLQFWVKADAIVGLNDGDPIATWADQSGNGRNATQATAGFKPVYKTNILNSKPVVRFDGTDDYLATAAFTLNQPSSILAVAVNYGNLGSPRFVSDALSANARGLLYLSGPKMDINAGSDLLLNIANDQTWAAISAIFNAGQSLLRWNASESRGNAGTGSASGIRLGSRGDVAAFLEGDIAEFVAYSAALNDYQRQALELYLAWKYALPAGYFPLTPLYGSRAPTFDRKTRFPLQSGGLWVRSAGADMQIFELRGVCSAAQKKTLEDFYESHATAGCLFKDEWQNPAVTYVCKFAAPLSFVPASFAAYEWETVLRQVE